MLNGLDVWIWPGLLLGWLAQSQSHLGRRHRGIGNSRPDVLYTVYRLFKKVTTILFSLKIYLCKLYCREEGMGDRGEDVQQMTKGRTRTRVAAFGTDYVVRAPPVEPPGRPQTVHFTFTFYIYIFGHWTNSCFQSELPMQGDSQLISQYVRAPCPDILSHSEPQHRLYWTIPYPTLFQKHRCQIQSFSVLFFLTILDTLQWVQLMAAADQGLWNCLAVWPMTKQTQPVFPFL